MITLRVDAALLEGDRQREIKNAKEKPRKMLTLNWNFVRNGKMWAYL